MKVSFWWVWGELGLERAKQTSRRSQANPSSPRTHQKLTFIQLVWLFDYSIEIIVLAWSESESSVAIILPFLGTRHQHTFLTFVSLILWPLLTGLQHWVLPTANMNRRSAMHMRKAFECRGGLFRLLERMARGLSKSEHPFIELWKGTPAQIFNDVNFRT